MAGLAPGGAAASGLPAAGSLGTVGAFEDGSYVVVLEDAPLATHPGTAGSALDGVDTTSAEALAHVDRLTAQQDAALSSVSAEPGYRYTVALNGFSAQLTAEQASELAQRGDVVSVTRSQLRQLDESVVNQPEGAPAQPDTDLSPDLLGLRGQGGVWSQVGGPMGAGAGTVVGVIDSGIAYDNPSFAADGMPAPPASWSGGCQRGEGADAGDFPRSACTDKIVGAGYFVQGARGDGYDPIAAESVSPLDTDGHGSHVAGTAAGREVSVEDGTDTYELAGMAPGAHVAAYKVCYDFAGGVSGCHPADSIAAVEAALADGVDVLNFSVSGATDTYLDPVDLAFKNAAAAGVFVATSAGNFNQQGVPVAHLGPWQTTVAASTHRPDDGPVPSIGGFSGRGPVAVDAREQTVLKPDIGAPGINVLAPVASSGTGPQWAWYTGTSMASPHIAGLGALLAAEHPDWSPMAIKSAMQTSTTGYANTVSNRAHVGGTGFVEPRDFLEPGLVFDSEEADWDAFLADPSRGTDLNAAYLHIPALGLTPTTVTRTLTNPGPRATTFEASFDGPGTLSVTVEPSTVRVPAGGSVEVSISVADTGAPVGQWQEGDLSWTSTSGATVVQIPVLARDALLVDRVSGTNRFGTAASIASLYPDGADTVYVASGRGFADAVAGGSAAASGLVPGGVSTPDGPAPMLLLDEESVPSQTRTALETLDPSRIVVLGGDAAVPDTLVQELEAYARVDRVSGKNRYGTAAALARMFDDVDTVYVATGESFADALTGSARAGMEGAPVLLTEGDRVPDATAEVLEDLAPDRVVVVGGEAAINDTVARALGADERVKGTNRYGTAVALTANQDADVPVVYIASGENFPDALAGSALAAAQGAPVLLTKPGSIPPETMAELDRLSPEQVVILGGEAAVSDGVQELLDDAYPGWVGSP
ncbi:cell wall-binding repeat-containing protein [Serinicoccus kebangsaanensis]|uniref:cell wall-binding repeat-containing protein n=1 Tax=Serinicoccus kebangsaanensis TaxID=2602069 RepID=UPI00178C8279|nr:cell wall-binding repeat-containing protein [Serinicoccus kebangsaanensis]